MANYDQNLRDCRNFFFGHTVFGFAISGIATAMILLGNVGNIRDLAMRSDAGVLAIGMLFVFLGSTLAACQITFALLFMGQGEPPAGRLQRKIRSFFVEPVRLSPQRVR